MQLDAPNHDGFEVDRGHSRTWNGLQSEVMFVNNARDIGDVRSWRTVMKFCTCLFLNPHSPAYDSPETWKSSFEYSENCTTQQVEEKHDRLHKLTWEMNSTKNAYTSSAAAGELFTSPSSA
jgi:hypothetical protein